MNTTYINLKSNSNYAAETLILCENGKGISPSAAPAFAAHWGNRNGSESVSYTVTDETGDTIASETIRIGSKPLAAAKAPDSTDRT